MDEPGDSLPIPVYRSELADELRRIGDDRLSVMSIPRAAVLFVEFTVILARALMDHEDPNPWHVRLELALNDDRIPFDEFQTELAPLADMDDGAIQRLLEHVTRSDTRAFYRRLLGAAAYDRLIAATASDSEAVLIAMKQGLRLLRPLAVAMQDSSEILSVEQFRAVGLDQIMSDSMLSIVLKLDGTITHVLDEVTNRHFDFDLDSLQTHEHSSEEILNLAQTLRSLTSEDLERRLLGVNSILERKFKGARDALHASADGPSQAANSLIELVDRLLRSVAPEDAVLLWCEAYPGERADLTYVTPSGDVRPTKRGECLFLSYGGTAITETTPFNELAATSLVVARNMLQKIKHADEDLDAARADVERVMRAVEGALALALRFAARRLDDGALAAIADGTN